MRSIFKYFITIFFTTTAFITPHCGVAAENKPLAGCDSQFINKLLNTPMTGLPHEDVWILLALDNVKIFGSCNYLGIDIFAEYLERQSVNDVVGEKLPIARTMTEAVRIESEIERSSPTTMEKLRLRAHTQSFSVELRKKTDPLPKGVEEPPQSDSRKIRNIWPSSNMAPPGIAVALAFTNITQRKIYWPSTDLFVRKHKADKYAWFFCDSGDRYIAPLERFVVFCSISTTDWRSDDEGLALIDGLKNRDNWKLRPDDTRHYWPAYRRTIDELTTQQSEQKAMDYLKASSCSSRSSCSAEFNRSPLIDNLFVKLLKLWIAWLPGLILGAILFTALWLLSNFKPISIAITLSFALIATAGFRLHEINKTLGAGWDGGSLMIWLIVACIGSLLGVWLLYTVIYFLRKEKI